MTLLLIGYKRGRTRMSKETKDIGRGSSLDALTQSKLSYSCEGMIYAAEY